MAVADHVSWCELLLHVQGDNRTIEEVLNLAGVLETLNLLSDLGMFIRSADAVLLFRMINLN